MRLIFFVILAHFFLLFLFTLNKPMKPLSKEKIIVSIREPKPIAPIKKITESKPTPTIKKKVETPPPQPVKAKKAAEPKKVSEKKSVKPTPNTKVVPQNNELLKKMKEGLSEIDQTSKRLHQKVSDVKPQTIGPLKSETLDMSAIETSYAEELAALLKRALMFPDIGEMKLKIKISRAGKVDSFQIISSTSTKNKEEASKINSLTFPPFGSRFPGESNKEFALHLNIDA